MLSTVYGMRAWTRRDPNTKIASPGLSLRTSAQLTRLTSRISAVSDTTLALVYSEVLRNDDD